MRQTVVKYYSGLSIENKNAETAKPQLTCWFKKYPIKDVTFQVNLFM